MGGDSENLYPGTCTCWSNAPSPSSITDEGVVLERRVIKIIFKHRGPENKRYSWLFYVSLCLWSPLNLLLISYGTLSFTKPVFFSLWKYILYFGYLYFPSICLTCFILVTPSQAYRKTDLIILSMNYII